MNRELIRSTAFIRAARRYLKKHPQAADDLKATLLLLQEDTFCLASGYCDIVFRTSHNRTNWLF